MYKACLFFVEYKNGFKILRVTYVERSFNIIRGKRISLFKKYKQKSRKKSHFPKNILVQVEYNINMKKILILQ